jgi:hypothetical protein
MATRPPRVVICGEQSDYSMMLARNLRTMVSRNPGPREPNMAPSVVCHAVHGAVQTISRSSPTHGLERRFVRFLRLHRDTLLICVFGGLPVDQIPGPFKLGSVGRTRAFFAVRSVGTVVDCQRVIRTQPHSRHSSQHPASSWVSARRLGSSILRRSAALSAHTPYRSLARTQSFQSFQ